MNHHATATCLSCGKSIGTENKRCVACLKKDARRAREKQARRRNSGLCIKCGAPRVPGKYSCSKCLSKAKAYAAARRRRNPHQAELCRGCGRPTKSAFRRCAACRLKERTRRATPKARAHAAKYRRDRKRTDPVFRLGLALRGRLYRALRGRYRSGLAVRALGCTIPQLKKFLEQNFLPGMAWGNYGNGIGRWSIDHIKPLARHDLTDEADIKRACHFTNLRPLWATENSSKGAKYEP